MFLHIDLGNGWGQPLDIFPVLLLPGEGLELVALRPLRKGMSHISPTVILLGLCVLQRDLALDQILQVSVRRAHLIGNVVRVLDRHRSILLTQHRPLHFSLDLVLMLSVEALPGR